jgi:hypothetical protein
MRLGSVVATVGAVVAAIACFPASGAGADTSSTSSPTTSTSTTVAPSSTTTSTSTTTTTTAPVTTTTVPSASTTTTTTTGPTTSTTSPPSNMKAIRAQQAALIAEAHRVAIEVADLAVSGSEVAVARDQLALQTDQTQAAAAAAAASAGRYRLEADSLALARASQSNTAAQGRLALDRAQLRGLALAVYTGALTGPQPVDLQSLPGQQEADLGRGEAEIVAQFVVSNLHSDVTGAADAGRRYGRAQSAVAGDRHAVILEGRAAAGAAARVPPDRAALAADRGQLATADRQLQRARADLTTALTALAGPASFRSGGLSILGSSALNARQLAAWFDAQGYSDLTAATISQLASWYIQAGTTEGVRGDVAFAQAVLETGGFSSPDAVALNNYAGIGHCDTCAAGWAFPSPHGGVIGHLQLLRIFATAAPAPRKAPAPVLPALTPAHQGRAGCCPTWESLTGTWATDPIYALSILSMYESMLEFAASMPPAAASAGAAPTPSTTTASSPPASAPSA